MKPNELMAAGPALTGPDMIRIHSFPVRVLFAWIAFSGTALAAPQQDAAQWLKATIAPCFSANDKVSSAATKRIESQAVTPKLKALLARDSADAARVQGEARLDFDWIIDAQDLPYGWSVGTAHAEGAAVIVPVSTRWTGNTVTYSFVLVPSGKHWLISDVRYPGNQTLLKILEGPL